MLNLHRIHRLRQQKFRLLEGRLSPMVEQELKKSHMAGQKILPDPSEGQQESFSSAFASDCLADLIGLYDAGELSSLFLRRWRR